MMKRTPLLMLLLVGLLSFFATVRATRSTPQTRENFDIRAGLQRTLNDPVEAEINLPSELFNQAAKAAPGVSAKLRRSELPYALKQVHPTVRTKWSSLTQAPSRLWSFSEALSAPSSDDAELIARRFLRNNEDLLRLAAADVAALQVTRRYQDAH